MSTPPRLDKGFRAFSPVEDEGYNSERLRAKLAQWRAEDEAQRKEARQGAIIAATMAIVVVAFWLYFGR